MKAVTLIAAVAVLALAVAVPTVSAGTVEVGTEANFNDLVKKAPLVLVEFYAPWCGHCKKLAPELEAAAKELPETSMIVKVDCTKEEQLQEQYQVSGYPTLKVFRNGKYAADYEGERTSKKILEYMENNSGPSVTTVKSAEALEELKKAHKTLCVVFTASADSKIAATHTSVADALRSNVKFAMVNDASIAGNEEMETVVVFKHFDDLRDVYTGDVSSMEHMKDFVLLARLKYIDEIGPLNHMDYGKLHRPMGWLFTEPASSTHASVVKEVGAAAKQLREKGVVFVWVDATKFGGVGKQLGLKEGTEYPVLVVDIEQRHFVMPAVEAYTSASVEEFVGKALNGEIESILHTEEAPEVATVAGLTTIVGSTLDEYLSLGKGMFIEFYAPWCGHCKHLAPIFEELAKTMEKDDVIIAKFNAADNDFDHETFKVAGYPTLFFVPPGGAPIEYTDARNVKDMKAFVEKMMATATAPAASEDLHGDL